MSLQEKVSKAIAPLLLFSMPDRSSEELIAEGRRMQLSTATWSEYKEEFIEYRFNSRKHEAWTKKEWAAKEIERVSRIDCSNRPDESVLKERYLEELKKIQAGKAKSQKPEPSSSFTWNAHESELSKLHCNLKKGRYIQAPLKDFQQLFKGQEASSIKPIQWKATQWELVFLIDKLIDKKLIVEGSHIQKICLCFIDRNGEPLKPNSIKTQLHDAKKGIAGKQAKERKLLSLIDSVASE